MNNLLTVYEVFTNGYSTWALDIVSLTAILCGIAIIINKNPIVSIIFLIGLFASIATYLILLGLTFIGLSYLIVYIGAVSILFLFILMLINIRTSELQSNNKNSIPLGLFVAILFNCSLFQLLPYYMAILNGANNKLNNLLYYLPTNGGVSGASHINQPSNIISNMSTAAMQQDTNIDGNNIMFVTSSNWDGNMVETGHTSAIGNILYTSYNMWIFMASLILLLAMTGAIIITIKSDKVQ